jgi:hypothetical protein
MTSPVRISAGLQRATVKKEATASHHEEGVKLNFLEQGEDLLYYYVLTGKLTTLGKPVFGSVQNFNYHFNNAVEGSSATVNLPYLHVASNGFEITIATPYLFESDATIDFSLDYTYKYDTEEGSTTFKNGFAVLADGSLYASNANISGNSTFGGVITSNVLSSKTINITDEDSYTGTYSGELCFIEDGASTGQLSGEGYLLAATYDLEGPRNPDGVRSFKRYSSGLFMDRSSLRL